MRTAIRPQTKSSATVILPLLHLHRLHLLLIGFARTLLTDTLGNAKPLLLHWLLHRREPASRTQNAAFAHQLTPRRNARDVLAALHRPLRLSLSGRVPTGRTIHTVATRADLCASGRNALELFGTLGLDRLLVGDDALTVTMTVADLIAWKSGKEVLISLFGCR